MSMSHHPARSLPFSMAGHAEMNERRIRESYARLGVELGTLRLACVTGGEVPVWTFGAGNKRPIEIWEQLRALHPQTGLWPVVFAAESLDRIWYFATEEYDSSALERGYALDAEEFFAERASDSEVPDARSIEVDEALIAVAPQGSDFYHATRRTRIGLVEAADGFEVPALLSWAGAASYELDGSHHLAVLRYWNQRHGAELVAMASDVLELAVRRPPRESAEVARVALEQYLYCPDLVEQGANTLDALASEHVVRHSWVFWWD
jgi:Domain of unknown function (DUF4253)